MDTYIINKQLQALYQPYLDSLYCQTWDKEVSAPLLILVFEEYTQVEKKILFVGQETHS